MSPARRIVMFDWLTADGYFAGPDGDSSTAPDPHRPGGRSREHRAVTVRLNELARRPRARPREIQGELSKHVRLGLVEARPYRSGDVLLRYARPG